MYIKLQDLLSVLTEEEREEFIRFVSQSPADKSIKKIPRLLYYILRKGVLEDEELIRKLYSTLKSNNVNAFRRLKNRAVQELNNFLLIRSLDQKEDIKTYLLAQFYRQKGALKIAIRLLEESEKKALQNENYHLLDSIYSEFILISLSSMEVDPNLYIEKREKNSQTLNKLREIEDFVAKLVYESKLEQAMREYDPNILEEVRQKISELAGSELFSKSYVFQKHLFQAVSRLLLKENDYCELLKYCKETFEQIEPLKKHDDFRLELIIYTLNAAYKCRQQKIIRKFYELFKQEFEMYPETLRKKYVFYVYYFDFIIYYIEENYSKAQKILLQAIEDKEVKKNLIYRNFTLLNLAVMYYFQQNYEKALLELNRIFNDPAYERLVLIFKLKIRAFEVMLLILLKEYELAKNIIARIKKTLRKNPKEHIGQRYKDFINLLKKIAGYYTASRRNKELLQEIIREFMERYDEKHEDIINYNAWLEKVLQEL